MVSPEEMANPDQARQLFGAEVVDADGAKVGTVTEVFLDDDTERPSWVSVRTGWFGVNESLVPLQGAEIADERIRVPYDKATIKDAPRSDDGQPLSRDDEGALYRHYHATDVASGDPDAAGPDTIAAEPDGTMVRSAERLVVRTGRAPTGRARLRKYLVTEEQQITVQVSREEVRVEYDTDHETDTDGDRPNPGADSDGWLVLYAQRPVVTTEWVAVERVRIGTVDVMAEETVTGEVREERIEVLTDDGVESPGVSR